MTPLKLPDQTEPASAAGHLLRHFGHSLAHLAHLIRRAFNEFARALAGSPHSALSSLASRFDAALRTEEGSEVCLAFAYLALALEGVALPPEAVDPEEARFVLERLRASLKPEMREIILA